MKGARLALGHLVAGVTESVEEVVCLNTLHSAVNSICVDLADIEMR